MWRIGCWCQTNGAVKLRITSQPSLGFTGHKEEKLSSEPCLDDVKGQRSDWFGDLRKTTVPQITTGDNLFLQNTCTHVHICTALTVLVVLVKSISRS